MRLGMSPTAAAKDAIDRMAAHFPDSMLALIAADVHGNFGTIILNNFECNFSFLIFRNHLFTRPLLN